MRGLRQSCQHHQRPRHGKPGLLYKDATSKIVSLSQLKNLADASRAIPDTNPWKPLLKYGVPDLTRMECLEVENPAVRRRGSPVHVGNANENADGTRGAASRVLDRHRIEDREAASRRRVQRLLVIQGFVSAKNTYVAC
mmetsp:Transcript_56645/g.115999  ORF Transcript_56645/g.115999 Transcript_56645/m.115999 type:complete len:139 (+) Transcript_56645:94-510(+)